MANTLLSPGTIPVGYYAMTQVLSASARDLGIVKRPRALRRRYKGMPLTSDIWGDTTIGGIYRGGDCFLQCVFQEWGTYQKAAFNPFGADIGALGQPGVAIEGLASQIVLTAQSGSSAASIGPATITAAYAVLAEEQDLEYLLGNEFRDVSVLFRLYPYNDATTNRFYSLT